jgi:hypothetical protein
VTASLETAKPVVAVKTKPVIGFEPDTGQAVDVIGFDIFHIDSVRFEYDTNEKYPLSLSPAQARATHLRSNFCVPDQRNLSTGSKSEIFGLNLNKTEHFSTIRISVMQGRYFLVLKIGE